jgi:hypothetical protein
MEYNWRNIRNMKAVMTWKNNNLILELFNRAGSGWTVTLYDEKGATMTKKFVRGFKSKSRALAFAKAYMRKN